MFPQHACKGLEKLSNADSTKHPTQCIASHSASIKQGTLLLLRLALGLLGTLQSGMVCQNHHCFMFGFWHIWRVVCKPGADQQQILSHKPQINGCLQVCKSLITGNLDVGS